MAVKKKFTDEQERQFEMELLSVLRRDKDHRFDFDGKLKVFSTRYGCTLQAVNVHWDERERDLVFVGAFRSGNPVMDTTARYPKLKQEISIPFRECFEDLKKMEGTNEMYLISKTRKAVLDKCIGKEAGFSKAYSVQRGGKLEFSDFFDKDFSVLNEGTPVGSVSVKDGIVEVMAKDGMPLDMKNMSLRDIQRIGEQITAVNDLIRDARKVYVDARSKFVQANGTVDESADRKGAAEGLAAVYEKGFPLRVCHGIAQSMSRPLFENVYNDQMHSVKDISLMLLKFRKDGKSFGFPEKRNGVSF